MIGTTIEVWWRWDRFESRWILAWTSASGSPRPVACNVTVTRNDWVWAGFWDYVTKRYVGGGDFVCAHIEDQFDDGTAWE